MMTVPLGEVIRPARVRRAGENRYPLLSMTMHSGLVDQSDKFKKRIASEDVSSYKVIQRGQLVVGFPIDEAVLDFQTLHNEGVVSPAYGVWDLVDDDRWDLEFLRRFLRSNEAIAYYKAKLRGSTARRRSLPTDVFLALPVPAPGIDEQRRIAEILGRAEVQRSHRRLGLIQLSNVLNEIFHYQFSDSRYATRPLAEVVQPGTIVTYGIVQAGDEFPGGVPYIRTGDISNGQISVDQLRRTDPQIAMRFARSKVDSGDIVMSIRATVGTVAMVPEELSGANLTQGTARISPSDVARGAFLLAYLRSETAQRWIQMNVKGATFREITLGALRALPVPLPPVKDQISFESKVSRLNEVRCVTSRAEALDSELIRSLQARAFRGEL